MILAIIQARMGSSRLPGKMLKEINKKPLILYALEQTKKSRLIDKIVLASTNTQKDASLLETAKKAGYETFAGSENDVLDRYYQAAKQYKGDIIVRITGDCPLIDPKAIDKVIQAFKDKKCDYASNVHPPTYPDGLDVEVFSIKTLEKAWKEAKITSEREHVTPYIWKNPQIFSTINVENKEDLSNLRWTVDEQEDLTLISEIIKKLGNTEINMENTLKIFRQNQELEEINKKYKRNEGYGKSLEVDKMKEIKNFKESTRLLKKAKEIIPSAAQTYSKSYRYFCEGAAPAFLERGEGSHVWDVDGNEYIDFICALGPVTAGYNNKEINKAIIEQLNKGISFSQPTRLEVELAQKLIEIMPSAEMVKFVKNGADATTAAVRLARAYTKKDVILCCGYHGFHDWYIGSTINDLGVPEAVKKLTKKFDYNNIESLKKLFEENKGKVAAVIMEPMQENGPEKRFLEEVKEITKKEGAVLIYDEVVSGFRMALGGAQEYFKVTPDMTAVGKGMANGLPLSALVGKKEIMKLIDEGAFVSLTFGGEALSLAGAIATIKILEKPGTFEHIWELGNYWKKEIEKIVKEKKLEEVTKITGAAPHCGILFKNKGKLTEHDLFSVFQQTLVKRGILTIGINNFCLSHTKEDVQKFIEAAKEGLDEVTKAIKQDSTENILTGGKVTPIFKRN